MKSLNVACIVISAAFMAETFSLGQYGMSLYFLGCMVINIVAVRLS